MNQFVLLCLYTVSGLFWGVSLIVPAFWWLSVVGVFLFILAISKTDTLVAACVGSFLGWMLKMLFTTSYILSVYPIRWIETGMGHLELPLIILYWISSAFSIGVVGLMFGFVIRHLWQFSKRILLTLLPILFAIFEIIGSFLYSLLMYGEGSSLGIANSGGYIGYALVQHSFLLQLAKWGGVFILTSTVALLGVLLYYLFNKISFPRFIIVSAGVVALLIISNNFYKPAAETNLLNLKVAVVDTYFGSEDFYQAAEPGRERDLFKEGQLDEAMRVALISDADYIIFSEDSPIINPVYSPEVGYKLFRFKYDDPDAVVMFAGSVIDDRNNQTRAHLRYFIYDGLNKTALAVDKSTLVPVGEYMPISYSLFLKSVSLLRHRSFLQGNVSIYRPGPYNSQNQFPSHIPGVLFCFESLNAFAAKGFAAKRDLNFIAHPISHTWFNNSGILQRQLDSILLVQSLWSGKDIISAGNAVPGFLYTKKGQKVLPEKFAENKWWRIGLVTI